MMHDFPAWPKRGALILLWWGLALCVYLFMVLGPLAELERLAGAPPFDLRPGGYALADALAFNSALGDEGRRLYLTRQIPLDMLYPALFAVSTASALCWLSRSMPSAGRWYRTAAFLAYGAALADYMENGLIVWMLNAGDDLSAPLVAAASMATLIKAALSTIVYSALMLALLGRGTGAVARWWQRRAERDWA